MFRRLVSNLPYNPSLIGQIGFYAGRLRQEKSIRRLSFVFMALAMVVQSLAVIQPPEKSLAASGNHIINGIQTRSDILAAFDNPNSDVKAIYETFSISRVDIANLTENPNATIRTNDGNDWWSIGRNSLYAYSDIADIYKQNQVAIQYSGKDTSTQSDDEVVYARQLKSWDADYSYSTYQAFKGTSSATGRTFWIIVNCGNITWIDQWPFPVESPELEIRKTTAHKPSETLKPGDRFTYQIEFRNKKVNTQAKNVYLEDQFDLKNYDIVSPSGLNIVNGFLRMAIGNVDYTPNYHLREIVVQLKNPIPSPSTICNTARLTADNASAVSSSPACVNVVTPCPYDTSIPDVNNPNCTVPKVVCSLVDAAVNRSTRTVSYRTAVQSSNDALVTISAYTYDFGDGKRATFKSSEFSHTTEHTYKPGEYTATVTVTFRAPTENGVTEQNVKCSQPINFDADQPLGQTKSVENLTKGLRGEAAISSSVNAGDSLQYTLTTLNSQDYDRNNVTIIDYIGDILDYAELDQDHLKAQGGTFNGATKKVTWENVKIAANSKIEHKFRVTLKNPVPATNSPSNLSTTFDCKISNRYGNEITLTVNCPIIKTIETLPSTGPGTSMLFGTAITFVISYLFARSRLLSKEIDLIRTDFIATGGI